MGDPVVGTSRSELRRSEIEDAGAEFAVLDLDDVKLPHPAYRSVTWLAPPGHDLDAIPGRVRNLVERVGKGVPITMVVSTAIYGPTHGTVTERTHPAPKTDRERRWALLEASGLYLRELGYDVASVRVPAIYGPGRDYRAKLLTHDAVVVRPGPVTSRIHVEDLAAILYRMAQGNRPPVLLACDDFPAPTSRVFTEAARLLKVDPPREITPEEAPSFFSGTELEMRLHGRSCRSLVRPWIGVRLRYPTYREGLRACLVGDPRTFL